MPSPPDLLLLPEVADMCRASVNSVRAWIREGKLPASRPGRRVLIRRADVETMLVTAAIGTPAAAPARTQKASK